MGRKDLQGRETPDTMVSETASRNKDSERGLYDSGKISLLNFLLDKIMMVS